MFAYGHDLGFFNNTANLDFAKDKDWGFSDNSKRKYLEGKDRGTQFIKNSKILKNVQKDWKKCKNNVLIFYNNSANVNFTTFQSKKLQSRKTKKKASKKLLKKKPSKQLSKKKPYESNDDSDDDDEEDDDKSDKSYETNDDIDDDESNNDIDDDESNDDDKSDKSSTDEDYDIRDDIKTKNIIKMNKKIILELRSKSGGNDDDDMDVEDDDMDDMEVDEDDENGENDTFS